MSDIVTAEAKTVFSKWVYGYDREGLYIGRSEWNRTLSKYRQVAFLTFKCRNDWLLYQLPNPTLNAIPSSIIQRNLWLTDRLYESGEYMKFPTRSAVAAFLALGGRPNGNS